MRGMVRTAFVALAIITTLAACGPQRPQPISAFEGRIDDWAREILADSPELSTQAGVTPAQAGGAFNTRLDDRSPVALEARRSAAIRRYAELRALDTGNLSDADRLTYDVLRAQFEAAAMGAEFDYGVFTPMGGISPYALNQMDSAFLTLPSFMDDRATVQSPADAEAYLTRLRAVGDPVVELGDRARPEQFAKALEAAALLGDRDREDRLTALAEHGLRPDHRGAAVGKLHAADLRWHQRHGDIDQDFSHQCQSDLG